MSYFAKCLTLLLSSILRRMDRWISIYVIQSDCSFGILLITIGFPQQISCILSHMYSISMVLDLHLLLKLDIHLLWLFRLYRIAFKNRRPFALLSNTSFRTVCLSKTHSFRQKAGLALMKLVSWTKSLAHVDHARRAVVIAFVQRIGLALDAMLHCLEELALSLGVFGTCEQAGVTCAVKELLRLSDVVIK